MKLKILKKIKNGLRFCRACLKRNKPGKGLQSNKVKLYFCSMHQPDDKENLGDWLTTYIVAETFKRLSCGLRFDEDVGETRYLYAVGSILFFGIQKATIWGSGMHEEAPWYRSPKIYKYDIRAVRGPLTRASLLKNGFFCPEVYGDPAVLLPLFYTPKLLPSKDFVVVKHKDSVLKEEYPEVDIMTNDPFMTIDQIVNAKLVISGSLHGIIIAESYGVPCIFVTQICDRWGYPQNFKYEDWYASTGRVNNYPKASTIDEALNMPIPFVPDLTVMQKKLLASFPIDLWVPKQ